MVRTVPPGKRGGSRSSRTRRGMRWTRAASARRPIAGRSLQRLVSDFAARRRTAQLVDGEVVWSWRPDAGVKLCKCAWSPTGRGGAIIGKATVARKPGHRGERGVSRKTIRAGKAGFARLSLWSTPRALFSRGGHGCSLHPAFPAPSQLKRARTPAKPRARRAAGTRARTLKLSEMASELCGRSRTAGGGDSLGLTGTQPSPPAPRNPLFRALQDADSP